MDSGGNVLAVRFWTKTSDETALESCVREHGQMVYRIAFSVLRNPHDAEDAAQETFLRALRSGRVEDVNDSRAWLAKIAWRIALDHRRPEDLELSAIVEPASGAVNAESSLLAGERTKILHELIISLPRDLQDVVTLSTVQELSGTDVAAILGIPEASVRTRMHRARELMKEKLQSRYGTKSARGETR
ncbi:sigma-24, ECF subfamily [Candidatus Koribacter versatilis Ellin345]|uniref:Sigma-24, ECF subfamily n=1 Tax=Koribacter versatilis (strain Ellin345) TaxID=204669 RepID=Q1IU58_KORVE|nr:RNA polymerase sigma factor [Candidatus Koribacter versatilis]ABF39592.1 sigma-24, ECF subfamily [Candidatus Koribacter versatilis Ellin345]